MSGNTATQNGEVESSNVTISAPISSATSSSVSGNTNILETSTSSRSAVSDYPAFEALGRPDKLQPLSTAVADELDQIALRVLNDTQKRGVKRLLRVISPEHSVMKIVIDLRTGRSKSSI